MNARSEAVSSYHSPSAKITAYQSFRQSTPSKSIRGGHVKLNVKLPSQKEIKPQSQVEDSPKHSSNVSQHSTITPSVRPRVIRNAELKVEIIKIAKLLKDQQQKEEQEAGLSRKYNYSVLGIERKRGRLTEHADNTVNEANKQQLRLKYSLENIFNHQNIVSKENELTQLQQELNKMLKEKQNYQQLIDRKSKTQTFDQTIFLKNAIDEAKEELLRLRDKIREQNRKTTEYRRALLHLTISVTKPQKLLTVAQKKLQTLPTDYTNNVKAKDMDQSVAISHSPNVKKSLKLLNVDRELKRLRMEEEKKIKLLENKEKELNEYMIKIRQLKEVIKVSDMSLKENTVSLGLIPRKIVKKKADV